jgi:hypothetical protein
MSELIYFTHSEECYPLPDISRDRKWATIVQSTLPGPSHCFITAFISVLQMKTWRFREVEKSTQGYTANQGRN